MNENRTLRWQTGAYFFFSGIVSSTWSSRIPDIQREMKLSNGELGAVLFAISAGLVMALPLSSWLVAKYGSERMMAVSAMVFAVIIGLLAFAPNVYFLVILLFLFGGVRNLVSISANTNSIEIQALFMKPIISTFHGVWSMACFIGVAIGGIMITAGVSHAWHFTAIGILMLIGAIMAKRNNPDRIKSSEKKSFFVKPDRYLFLLGCIAFCAMFCESSMFDWSINYYDKVIESDKNYVTFGYSAFIIMMTAGRLIGDKIIALFGPLPVLAFNGLLMTAGFIIVIAFPFVSLASVGLAFVGLGSSIVVPIVYSLAGKSTRMTAGYAIAAVTVVGYVGFLSSPLIIGALADRFGMQTAFGILIVTSLSISILALGLIKNWWVDTKNKPSTG